MIDITKKKILVDTNILVYTLDKKSPHFRTAASFFKACEEKQTRVFAAHQNVLELVRTLISGYGLSHANSQKKARLLVDGEHVRLIHPLSTTLNIYYELAKSGGIKRGNMFDYYLAATVLDNDIFNIVTNDPKDFANIPNFKAWSLKDVETE